MTFLTSPSTDRKCETKDPVAVRVGPVGYGAGYRAGYRVGSPVKFAEGRTRVQLSGMVTITMFSEKWCRLYLLNLKDRMVLSSQ